MEFNILIIDDNSQKVGQVQSLLIDAGRINPDSIDHALDARNAKILLRKKSYDLVILDIALPIRIGEEIDPMGGLKLLNEIVDRDIYITPQYVIALTAHDESFTLADSRLSEISVTTVKYEDGIEGWKQTIVDSLKVRVSAKIGMNSVEYDYYYDIAFICALEIEFEQIISNGWDWERLKVPNDDTIYYSSFFNSSDGSKVSVVASSPRRMGMPATSALTMKLQILFRPRYMIMTGIMAGIRGKVDLGDIVVANPVWDWGSGKLVGSGKSDFESPLFQIHPIQFSLDQRLLKLATLLSAAKPDLFVLRKSFGAYAPKTDLTVHIGPVASGAPVVADQEIIDNIVKQNRKVLGIEMEAFGFYLAGHESTKPRPSFICMKTVVDFADETKVDDIQHYGVFASARLATLLAEKYLFSEE